jgi:hypothetical protein
MDKDDKNILRRKKAKLARALNRKVVKKGVKNRRVPKPTDEKGQEVVRKRDDPDAKKDVSVRQEAVAVGVACGMSLSAAAKQAGVCGQTAKEWSSALPAFRRRVQELRDEMTSQALGRLIKNLTVASDKLASLCNTAQSEGVQLGAARSIFEMAGKEREMVEVKKRLAKLEEILTRGERDELDGTTQQAGEDGSKESQSEDCT